MSLENIKDGFATLGKFGHSEQALSSWASLVILSKSCYSE